MYLHALREYAIWSLFCSFALYSLLNMELVCFQQSNLECVIIGAHDFRKSSLKCTSSLAEKGVLSAARGSRIQGFWNAESEACWWIAYK
jgi:hypothetical protein